MSSSWYNSLSSAIDVIIHRNVSVLCLNSILIGSLIDSRTSIVENSMFITFVKLMYINRIPCVGLLGLRMRDFIYSFALSTNFSSSGELAKQVFKSSSHALVSG